MPANQSLGVRGTRTIDTAIRQISVSAGSVILQPPDGGDAITLGKDQDKSFDPPQSGFVVYAPEGARFYLTYETDAAGTEAARDQVGLSEQPQEREAQKDKGGSRTRGGRSKSTARAASKRTRETGKKSSSGKASASKSSPKGGSRASKSASSKSGARKGSSTKSTKKRS